MTSTFQVTEDQLVSELWARDVPFLLGEQISPAPLLDPTTLIQSLAQSKDARVRMALIPLFLRHPEFSGEARKADETMPAQSSQLVLRFYYTAASLLQQKYREQLVKLYGNQKRLPDLFSNKLGVSLNDDPNKLLLKLAKRHQVLSGQRINWLESYEHSAERLIKYVEKFK
ncbi:MAG TPA: hypothetical protein PLA27_00820 [Anaerolineales bacterium]|jgi:hypothetical protein|nr:hypothetical protein [Anaerolineales bacterium]HQX14932.1 hypothetical protein [Anaerolineales bacterium]